MKLEVEMDAASQLEKKKQETIDLVKLPIPQKSHEMEEILCKSHFHEVNGFYFKEAKGGLTDLDVTPTVGLGQISVSVARWKMDASTLPSSPSPPGSINSGMSGGGGRITRRNRWNNVIIGLTQGKTEILEMILRSQSSLIGNESIKQHLAEVYIPQMPQNLGRIKYNIGSFVNSTLITDCVTKSVFITSPLSDLNNPASLSGFKISDINGLPVAIVQSRKGKKQRLTGRVHWTDWKIQYAPLFSASLMPSEKALLMMTAMLWVMTTKEKSQRIA